MAPDPSAEFRRNMRFRYTRRQVVRGTLADAEEFDRIVLIKNVSIMRAAHQVRLLALVAIETDKKLVIIVPRHCRIDRTLRELMKLLPKTVRVERAR